jgi:hypothetical protein
VDSQLPFVRFGPQEILLRCAAETQPLAECSYLIRCIVLRYGCNSAASCRVECPHGQGGREPVSVAKVDVGWMWSLTCALLFSCVG